jgi:hypothetical protein
VPPLARRFQKAGTIRRKQGSTSPRSQASEQAASRICGTLCPFDLHCPLQQILDLCPLFGTHVLEVQLIPVLGKQLAEILCRNRERVNGHSNDKTPKRRLSCANQFTLTRTAMKCTMADDLATSGN